MDGSGQLFEDFVHLRPQMDLRVVRYPFDPSWRLDDYVAHARAVIRAAGPCVVLAESFSGAVALRLARLCEEIVGIVWVASFLRCPNPLLKLTPLAAIGEGMQRRVTSLALIRLLCLDFRVADVRVQAVQHAVRALPVEVLRSRLRLLRDLDEETALSGLEVPWLALTASRDRLLMPAAFPSARTGTVVSVDGPHFLLQAQPQECWQRIDRWLAELED